MSRLTPLLREAVRRGWVLPALAYNPVEYWFHTATVGILRCVLLEDHPLNDDNHIKIKLLDPKNGWSAGDELGIVRRNIRPATKDEVEEYLGLRD